MVVVGHDPHPIDYLSDGPDVVNPVPRLRTTHRVLAARRRDGDRELLSLRVQSGRKISDELRPVGLRGCPRRVAIGERENFIVEIDAVVPIGIHQRDDVGDVLGSQRGVGKRGGHRALARTVRYRRKHRDAGPLELTDGPRRIGGGAAEVGIEPDLDATTRTGGGRVPERRHIGQQVRIARRDRDPLGLCRRGQPVGQPAGNDPLGRRAIGASGSAHDPEHEDQGQRAHQPCEGSGTGTQHGASLIAGGGATIVRHVHGYPVHRPG